MTPAEKRVARVVLSDYPSAGLFSSTGFFSETTVSFFMVVYSSYVACCFAKEQSYNTGCTTSLLSSYTRNEHNSSVNIFG